MAVPQAEDVAQQHPFPPVPVEGDPGGDRSAPQCRSPKLPHAACAVCGTYNGRQILEV